MLQKRIIPVLLLHDQVLYKTVQFKKPRYVGDPINTVRIFNEKEVDELVFIDIDASKNNGEPNYKIIESIASECFMPLCYGGGIKTVDHVRRIFSIGVEKIILNSILFEKPAIITHIAEIYGTQSIICSVDIKKSLFSKYKVYNHITRKTMSLDPLQYAQTLEKLGAGEILINMVDDDGTRHGYNIDFLNKFSSNFTVPIIASGGADTIMDFEKIFAKTDISAAAAGSMFVFYGKHKAVLITYPQRNDIESLVRG